MQKVLYTSFILDNDPIDQPTPKMVWGNKINTVDLKVGDELHMIHNPRNNFFVKEIVSDEKIILTNPRRPEKNAVISKQAPLYKVVTDIPMDQQEFFIGNQSVEGTLDSEGVFNPDEKYLIDYKELFHKYFELIRKTLYDDRVQYNLTYMYEDIFNEMGTGNFNEYIRVNFVDCEEEDKEEMFSSAYEYGLEFYEGNSFLVSMLRFAQTMDQKNLFETGIKVIVFNEGLKLDFSKL